MEQYKDRDWLECEYKRTRSIYAIAEATGKCPKTIQNWLVRLEIERLPMTGRKQTPETREKKSHAHKGQKPMLGKQHSDETKAAMSEAHKGNKNANWKGGITKTIRELRRTKEYVAWRQTVIERANGICEECGMAGDLEAHHIVSLHKDITLALELTNGQALCPECHKAKRRKS